MVLIEIVSGVQKLGIALLCFIVLSACLEEPNPNFVRVVNQTGQPIDEVILYVDNSQFFGSLAPGDTTDYRYYPYDILDEPALSINIGNDTLYTYTYFLLKITQIGFGPPLPRERHTFEIAIDSARKGTNIQFN